jgi:hypothetical protein
VSAPRARQIRRRANGKALSCMAFHNVDSRGGQPAAGSVESPRDLAFEQLI